jgi:hypothetical protein
MNRLRIYCIAALVGVGVIVTGYALIVRPEVEVHEEIAAAEKADAPDLRIDDVHSLRYPDPLHVQLPDGRVFRWAHVVGPDAGTPEYAPALELARGLLSFNHNRKAGLRTKGVSAEPWGLQLRLARCGNLTSDERRRLSIPRWRNLSGMLLSSGLFWLEPGVTDLELLQIQSAARKEGVGVWANPVYLRRLVDLADCEARVQDRTLARAPGLREQRLEAALLLLRTDPQASLPRLLSVVKDPQDDVYARIGMAQLLDRAGYKEGTEFLMEAVRLRRDVATEAEINTIHSEYARFRRQRAYEQERAAIDAYNDALRHEVDGDIPGAIARLEKLISEAPPDWTYRRDAADRLEQIRRKR